MSKNNSDFCVARRVKETGFFFGGVNMVYFRPLKVIFCVALLLGAQVEAKLERCLQGLRGPNARTSERPVPSQGMEAGESYSYQSLLDAVRRSPEFTFKPQRIRGLVGEFVSIEPSSLADADLQPMFEEIPLRPLHVQANLEILLKDDILSMALMRTRGQIVVEESIGGSKNSTLAHAIMALRDQYFLEQNQLYIFLLSYLKAEDNLRWHSGTQEWLLKKWETTPKFGDHEALRGLPLHGELYLSAHDRRVILQVLYDHWSAQPWRRPEFNHYMTQIGERLFASLSTNAASSENFDELNLSQEVIALRSLVHFHQEFWNSINQIAYPLQFSKTQWLDLPEKAKHHSGLARVINSAGLKVLLPKLHDPRFFYRLSY